jgi:integrase/recombinase XerD
MARQPPQNAFDDLAEEKVRRVQDLLPAIERAQELMRHVPRDSVRRLLEAVERQDALLRQVSDSLKLGASAMEAAKSLTAISDATSAFTNAFRVDTSVVDMGKTMSVQTAGVASAITEAMQINMPAVDAAKTLALVSQATAAGMAAAMRVDTSALDRAGAMASQLAAVQPLVAALQRAIPDISRFGVNRGLQDAVRAMSNAPQLAAALQGPGSFVAIMRDVAQVQASFQMPALFEAQRLAASIASALPRLTDLSPERFGVTFAGTDADAAWQRLMAKAEAIAADDDAGPDAVIALAEDADALAAAAEPEAKDRVNEFLQVLIFTLIADLLKDGIKASALALLPYLVALPLLFEPVAAPALPTTPPPFSTRAFPTAPDVGARSLPRGWEVAGLPGIIQRAGPEAERRTLSFFAGVRNSNTRQAYAQAVMRFMTWCADRNLALIEITPFTVEAYIDEMNREYAARTTRQHLGAIRGLFDQLVAGKVLPTNPASAVRGPKDEARKGKTSVLEPHEIRQLLDSIDVSECPGLRDRALLSVMAYGFGRVSAVVAMDVKDYCDRDGQRWLRLRERGGKPHEVPAHRKAREYLDAYVDAAGIAGATDSPLWRTMSKEGAFGDRRMSRVDVFRMVKRRLREAGLGVAANCESIRAAGIASYLANGGTLVGAQAIAAQASLLAAVQQETAANEITAAEIEKIGI